jgi:2-oxoglutarate ferredoxin oxidoreductase subunit gamma
LSENSNIFAQRDETRIRFGGSGGQGAVLAATLLGEAAVASGLYAAGSSAYGSQARGGAASSDLIVSGHVIDYPHVSRPDVFVALSQEAYSETCVRMAGGGVIIFDSFFVTPGAAAGVIQYAVPATEMVLKDLGANQGANIMMIGAVVQITGMVQDEAILKAIESNLDSRFHERSKRAYRMGREFAKTMKRYGSG